MRNAMLPVPRLVCAALLLLGTACGDAVSTGPVVEDQFTWFGIGSSLRCGIRPDASGWCQAYSDPQLVRLAEPAAVSEFSFGWSHTCALATDGTAWCWGDQFSGQAGELGRLGGNPRTPAPVDGDTRFRSIATLGERTCGIALDRAVWCWGTPWVGFVLGWPLETYPEGCSAWTCYVPAPLATELRFDELGVGERFDCGRTAGGQVWCWGRYEGGELGNGELANPDACGSDPCAKPPTRVEVPRRLTALAVATSGACALDDDRHAWCWGNGGPWPVRIEGIRFRELTGGTMVCGLDTAAVVRCFAPRGAGSPRQTAPAAPLPVVPGFLFERIFPSPAGSGCGWNPVTGAACWAGPDGHPVIIPGQV